jgi:hypothetical protein
MIGFPEADVCLQVVAALAVAATLMAYIMVEALPAYTIIGYH